AFRLHNITTFTYIGGDNPTKRARTLASWRASTTTRVLLMSQDIHWSGLHEDQIDARACRMGQTRSVHCYHFLARGTSDTLMDSNAREKHLFLAGLTVENPGNTALEDLYAEVEEDLVDDDALQENFIDDEAMEVEVGASEEEEEVRRMDDADADLSPPQSSPVRRPQWTFSNCSPGPSGLTQEQKVELPTAGYRAYPPPDPRLKPSVVIIRKRVPAAVPRNQEITPNDTIFVRRPSQPSGSVKTPPRGLDDTLQGFSRLSITPRPADDHGDDMMLPTPSPPPLGQGHLPLRSLSPPATAPQTTQTQTTQPWSEPWSQPWTPTQSTTPFDRSPLNQLVPTQLVFTQPTTPTAMTPTQPATPVGHSTPGPSHEERRIPSIPQVWDTGIESVFGPLTQFSEAELEFMREGQQPPVPDVQINADTNATNNPGSASPSPNSLFDVDMGDNHDNHDSGGHDQDEEMRGDKDTDGDNADMDVDDPGKDLTQKDDSSDEDAAVLKLKMPGKNFARPVFVPRFK
ncbi:hypothetical protein CPB83DRAFT_918544, partial [Crepidotus variabilis]